MRSSSSAARGPVVSQPDRSVSTTAAISSSPIAGGWKPSLVLRGVRIDQEAYGLRRTASPGEGIFTIIARRENRAGTVGPAAKRPETPPGAAVGSDPGDALDGFGGLHALRRAEHALGRDEEEDARPARARCSVRSCDTSSQGILRRARTRPRGR